MGYKILLADDSVTVQKIITLTFSDEGADVLAVNNGDDAIHRLQYMRPALVMADVSIPGKNGYEICEFVKNHPEMKNTPVVLLVPAFEPFDEERARRIGADQHLTKPFQSIRTLITTVKGLIEANPPKFATGSLNIAAVPVEPPPPVPSVEPVAEPPEQTFSSQLISNGDAPSTQPFPAETEEETAQTQNESNDFVVEEIETAGEIVEEVQEFRASDTLIDYKIDEEMLAETVPSQITDSVTQSNVKVLVEIQESVETPIAVAESQPPATVSQNLFNADVDHVLDLDDVLGWPPLPAPEPMVESPQVVVPAAPSFTPAPAETTIPQSVIDEIVNRVVEQLSEKLTAKLAAQIAPEVAEMVKGQIQNEAAPIANRARPESDSLLDLD